MTGLTATQQSFVDLMKTNNELAFRGFQLLLQREDFANFFKPLKHAGFFSPQTNPEPIAGGPTNSVRVPYWPPLNYLKAIAKEAGARKDQALADEIMTVVRDVSNWSGQDRVPRQNYHTNRTFLEIIGQLPTKSVTLNDIGLIELWLKDEHGRTPIIAALNDGVFSHFLEKNDPEDLQKATQILHLITAIDWQKDGDDQERAPYSRVDDFWLGMLLRTYAKEMGRLVGQPAADVMLERLREVFSTPLRRNHSNIFRPAVEDNAQNYRWRSAENRVVEGFRDVLLGWADTDPVKAGEVVAKLLQDDLQIVRRIGIYLLSEKWARFGSLYEDFVTPESLIDGIGHELYHLLQGRFIEMTAEQQSATLAAIKELPAQPSKDPERTRRRTQYRWLSAVQNRGNERADELFGELHSDPTVGPLGDHPDFSSYITGWAGLGETPYSPEELMALAKEGILVSKLNLFLPRDEWHGPTSAGLANSLEAAARKNPGVFLENLFPYLDTKPNYQHAVISGLKQAWEANYELDWALGWDQLVGFFEQLIKGDQFWPYTHDPEQPSLVSVIADFLHAGTQRDEHAYDPDLLERTQEILAALLEGQEGTSARSGDAMTQAINTPKGRIIEALYSQALRAARLGDQLDGSHARAWDSLKSLFETELDKCKNANFEFSTLSGTYLPQLQYLDSFWTAARVDDIFPLSYPANMLCAMEGLAYASFTQPVYELLTKHEIVLRALTYKLEGRGAREKLVERIGAAYLWGLESLTSPVLSHMFATAEEDDLAMLNRVFWQVHDEALTHDQKERIIAYWERTLEWAKQRPHPPERVLSTLSLLATFIEVPAVREQHLLQAVAPHVHHDFGVYEFVDALRRLAPLAPEAIARTLELMITADIPQFDYENRIRLLLESLAISGQRPAVLRMCEQLRKIEGIRTLFKSLTAR